MQIKCNPRAAGLAPAQPPVLRNCCTPLVTRAAPPLIVMSPHSASRKHGAAVEGGVSDAEGWGEGGCRLQNL